MNIKKLLPLAFIVLLAASAGAQTVDFTAGQGVELDSGDGVSVTLGENTGLSYQNPYPDSTSVQVQSTTVTGPDDSTVTLYDPGGSAPTLESIDTAGDTVEADTTDIQTVAVDGSISSLTYRDVDLQDASTTEFDVDGSGTLMVHGFAADETVRVIRAGGDDELVDADGSGVATISISNGAELTLVETGGPTLSNPSPTGGETLSSPPVQLEVDVEDPDLGTTNEEVDLEWFVDGELDGTTTATSNGTQTFESDVDGGGPHNWHVVATDSEGTSDRSPTTGNHSYSLPSELDIYQETDATQLVENVEVEIVFYGEETTVRRTTSDGVISMQGLPTDERFVVVAQADGYHDRRIIIDSLIDQEEVFLLNDSLDTVQNEFVLEDFTGQFPTAETRFYVVKDVPSGSEETVRRTIAGDYFGASGRFPVTLEQDTRYRLRVENEEGQVRDLGTYISSEPGVQQIRLGTVEPDVQRYDSYFAGNTINELEDGTRRFEFRFEDPEAQTTDFEISVYDPGNETSPLFEDSWSGPRGSYIATVNLPDDVRNVMVNWSADRGGEEIGYSQPAGGIATLNIPFDARYLSNFAFAVLIVLPMLASPRYAPYITTTTVAMAGVFMALTWYFIHVWLWWIGALIAVGSVVYRIQSG